MKTKLTIELVPSTTWGENLRSMLSKSEWDRIRKSVYEKAKNKCEICGGVGPKWPVECHEIWQYEEESKTQFLRGFIALCPKCHQVKHMGRTMSIGKGKQATQHLARVNGWSIQDAQYYIEVMFEIWHRRSQENWTLDISWLKDNGFQTIDVLGQNKATK